MSLLVTSKRCSSLIFLIFVTLFVLCFTIFSKMATDNSTVSHMMNIKRIFGTRYLPTVNTDTTDTTQNTTGGIGSLPEHGSRDISLVNNSGICRKASPQIDHSGTPFYSTGSHAMCVAVLTGYPDVARWEYVTRLLANLRHDVISPEPYDLHVFCQGPCHVTLCEEMNMSLVYHEITKTAHMELPISRQTMRKILYPDRWYYLSQNYRIILEELFIRYHSPYRHCLILEDDLLLSPDALFYTSAGMKLMDKDETVFSISLNTINSDLPNASNMSDFRRVNHFSPLGFVMSRTTYVKRLRRKWVRNKPWDLVVQALFDKNPEYVAIQPEVTRSVHEYRKHVRNMTASREVHSETVIATNIQNAQYYNLDYLIIENYDKYVRIYIKEARNIDYMEDALLQTTTEKLVYLECKDEEDMHRILMSNGLVGRSLGGAVRGIYKQTVFVPYYYTKILVVCKTSPFYPTSIRPSPRITHSDSIKLIEGTVPRRVVGPVTYLTNSFTQITSNLNESCTTACERKTGTPCDDYGLILLRESCEVVLRVPKVCVRCKEEDTTDKPHPYVTTDGTCYIHVHHAKLRSCSQVSYQSKLLCTCHHESVPLK